MNGSQPPAEGICCFGIALLQDPCCEKHQIHLHSHKSKGPQSMISCLAISKFMLLLLVKEKTTWVWINLKRNLNDPSFGLRLCDERILHDREEIVLIFHSTHSSVVWCNVFFMQKKKKMNWFSWMERISIYGENLKSIDSSCCTNKI